MNIVEDTPDSTALVLRPGDPGYDDELGGFQTGFAQRPSIVHGASSAEDVVAAVRYAAERGLSVGVRATGHGMPGASAPQSSATPAPARGSSNSPPTTDCFRIRTRCPRVALAT